MILTFVLVLTVCGLWMTISAALDGRRAMRRIEREELPQARREQFHVVRGQR